MEELAPVAAAPVAVERKLYRMPMVVGAAAGVMDGAVSAYGGTLKYREGFYKSALIGAGVVGNMLGWPKDVSYALMCSGAFGLAERIPGSLKAGTPGTVFTSRTARAVPSRARRPATAPSAPVPPSLPRRPLPVPADELMGIL